MSLSEKIFKPSARGKVWRVFIAIVLSAAVGGAFVAGPYYNRAADYLQAKTGGAVNLPNAKAIPFRLGLDLQGGSQLVYEADMSAIEDADRASALEGARDVIERRVNVFGVSEPLVQTSISGGAYRIIVELAGVKDINEAIKMIGETPLLEFKEQSGEVRQLTDEEKKRIADFNLQAEKRAEEVLGKLLSNGDFAALAKEYSDEASAKENGGDLGWISESSNPDEVSKVKSLKEGQITEDLVSSEQGYEIYKLEGKRVKTDPFNDNQKEKEVKASHLLVCYQDISGCESGLSKDEAYAKIKELKEKATPANFSALVKANSTEPGAAQNGGELGWFAKGAMVKPFEDTVFAQAKRTISYVVETQFGYHLIYKQDERDITEYSVRRIAIKKLTEREVAGEDANWKNTELTGKNLDRATVQFNPNDNTPEVSLAFDSEGADMFEKITERNIGKPVAIYLDGEAISVPTVNEKISGGKAVISGKFNVAEAKLLAQRLNAGALPVPVNLVNQQTVGASLGKSSLDASLKAGLWGFLLVAIFMLLYYRLPGFLAVISLAFYSIFVLLAFKLLSVTLTLAGMAGFILSIGMAVDANVLIFARLREELRAGKPAGLSIDNAFVRAWPSIWDGNISTLITCLILMWFSTSIVKGFAITLSIGIIISMLSAYIITRNFMRLIPEKFFSRNLWLIGGIK